MLWPTRPQGVNDRVLENEWEAIGQLPSGARGAAAVTAEMVDLGGDPAHGGVHRAARITP